MRPEFAPTKGRRQGSAPLNSTPDWESVRSPTVERPELFDLEPQGDDRVEKLFPSDVYGRIALALASLFFGTPCWLVAFGILFAHLTGRRPAARGVEQWLVVLIVEELSLSFGLFFACGLLWALAKPHWLRRHLPTVATKLALAMALSMALLGFLVAWVLYVG